jgi:hypothetical protein
MAERRRVLARLRTTPCGMFGGGITTICLEQRDSSFSLSVRERDSLTGAHSKRRVAVDSALVHEQLMRLRQSTVPAFPVSPVVSDGAYVELRVEGELSTLTLGWWTVAPDGAEGVSDFAEWMEETVSPREHGLEDD